MENEYPIVELQEMSFPSFENYYSLEAKHGISLNEYYTRVLNEAIDKDEGFGNKLRPVFIITMRSAEFFDKIADKVAKGQEFWHAAIGFGPSLSRTYSFNYMEASANGFKGGLAFEGLSFYRKTYATGTMEVNCVFIDEFRYKKLKATLDYYIKNKQKTSYNFIGLVKALFNKKEPNKLKMNMVCSQFVDTILKSADVDVNGKNSNVVWPDDLKTNPKNGKQFKIYSGSFQGYDVDKATKLVDKLSKDVNNEYDRSENPAGGKIGKEKIDDEYDKPDKKENKFKNKK